MTSPPLSESLFLPQRPYIILGSLKDNAVYPRKSSDFTDEEVREVLKKVNLGKIEAAVGGLTTYQPNLANQLSLGEQQRLGFARYAPISFRLQTSQDLYPGPPLTASNLTSHDLQSDHL